MVRVEQISKVPWVRWYETCKPKKYGGLGVKDLRLVNLALRAKQIWTLLIGSFGLWFKIIISCYSASIVSSQCVGRSLGYHTISTWQKGVYLIESKKNDPLNWFELDLVKKLWSYLSNSFQGEPLLGSLPLKIRFYRIFSISQFPNGIVGEVQRCD